MAEFLEEIKKARDCCRTSKYDEAERFYKNALHISPQNCSDEEKEGRIDAYEEFADVLYVQHKFTEAENNYNECIKLAELDATYKNRVGLYYLKLGSAVAKQASFREAKDIFNKALEKFAASHTDSSADFEVDENVASVYNTLAEMMNYLGEENEEKHYKTIAKSIEQTLTATKSKD